MSAPTTVEWLRTAAHRVTRGSGIVLRRITRRSIGAAGDRARGVRAAVSGWLGESDGAVDTALRWGMLAVGGWVCWALARFLGRTGVHALGSARWLLWPAAVLWLICAYRAGRDGDRAEERPADGETAPEGPAETSPGPDPAAFIALLHDELADARAVHLRHLAVRLAVEYPHVGWTVAAVRELCEVAGVPVARQVRAHGSVPTRGVRREDLPPLPPEGVPEGGPVDVDAAGQPSTSTSTVSSTARSTTLGEDWRTFPDGTVMRFVDDPDNPVRTHIEYVDPAV